MKNALMAALLAVLSGSSTAPPQADARPAIETVFESAPLRQRMQEALSEMIHSAVPDPKGEHAAFLAKTGFVILLEPGGPRLGVVQNPHSPFLHRLADLHADPDAAQKLLRLCREEEPERTRKLASYTIQRVLERLERDRQEQKLAEAARRAIARAVIEELVATASIDSGSRIEETIQAHLAERGVRDQDLLGYGFSLIENESPGPNEWDALQQDARLFLVRFSPQGFTIYQVKNRRREARSYSTASWRRETADLLAEFTARRQSAGKLWMGISPY